jgi:hypothetical protein
MEEKYMMNSEDALNPASILKPEPEQADSCLGGNGSGVSTSIDLRSLPTKPSETGRSSKRKGTGPKTEVGKRRSSSNALKTGVYSKAPLLPGESPSEYKRLLAGLRTDHRPIGVQEEIVIGEMAFVEFRKRRLRLAEWAIIRKDREFLEWDQRNRSGMPEDSVIDHDLIQNISNPDVLRRCIEMLSGLQELLAENGFNPENDKNILVEIYGGRSTDLFRENLYDHYDAWQYTSETSEEEREHEGYASPEECRSNIIGEIKKEVCRLRKYQREQRSIEAKRTELEVLSRIVPDVAAVDRLLRSEVHLSREYDRLLSRLERLQRMRLGQPVLPRIEVDVR